MGIKTLVDGLNEIHQKHLSLGDDWSYEGMALEEIERLRAEVAALKQEIEVDEQRVADLMAQVQEIAAERDAPKQDRDEWKDATTSANQRFKIAEQKLAALKAPVGMEPVAEVGFDVFSYRKLIDALKIFPDGTALYSATQLAQVQRERDELKELWGEMLERYTAYKKDAERYVFAMRECDIFLHGEIMDNDKIDAAMQKEKE